MEKNMEKRMYDVRITESLGRTAGINTTLLTKEKTIL